MLGTLKNIFSKKKALNSAAETNEFGLASNPDFLSDPNKIAKLLTDIENNSPTCTISFTDINEQFSSSILDVQVKNQLIILDELIPKHGNELLTKKCHLKLSTFFNDIHLAFNLNDIVADTSRGIAYYKTPFPNKIYYPQRRNSPRIQINSLNIPFSGLSSKTGTSVDGYILNLSRSGIALSMQNNRARIQPGHILKDCKITLDDHPVTFDLNVRFVKSISAGRKLIGGKFENIAPKKRSKLEHFITSLEQEEIRKRNT